MIEYIVLSYIFMGVISIYDAVKSGDVKLCFKIWLFSPLAMPVFFIVKLALW